MHEERPFKDKVTVRFVKRDDGGLRALCEAVPGFLPISRPLGSASQFDFWARFSSSSF